MSEDEDSRQPASDGSKARIASDGFPRTLDDISDRIATQRLQDAFVLVTGVGTVVVDAEGRPWTTPSEAWRPIFGESGDVEAYRQVGLRARDAGTYVIREREAGTYDACAPVFLGDWHLGSWLCGPVRVTSETEKADRAEPVPTMTMDAFVRLVTWLDEVARVQSSHGHRMAELRSWCASRRHLERHLNSVLNALADPVFVKDEQHRWVTLNDAFCSFMGRTREELLGKSDFDFFPEEEALEFWRVDDEVLRTGEAVTNEERLTDASGMTHVISTKKTMFIEEDGKRYLVGVIRDITARHKVEAELSRHREHLEELVAERTLALSSANRMLQLEIDERRRAEAEKREMQAQIVHQQKIEAIGRLAGGIAHDFNNLLTTVMGNAGLAMARLEPGSETSARLKDIMRAADSAAALTRQLLTFSRRQVIEPRPLDLNRHIEKSARLLERLLGEGIRLDLLLAPGVGPIMADPSQIEQILINLAVNSRDAMPDGGTITIETRNQRIGDPPPGASPVLKPGDYVALFVADSGMGIPEADLDRIFDPFFTTKPVGQGTGLGLASVYGAVQQNGGSIEVRSARGRGTVMTIYFPATGLVPRAAAPPDRPVDLPGGDETILLVEDDAMVLEYIQMILSSLGYRVRAAADGAAALSLASIPGAGIELLLTDVILPDMTGMTLAAQARKSVPGLKVLTMSGHAENMAAHEDGDTGSSHFIAKPFTTQELADKVRQVLDEK